MTVGTGRHTAAAIARFFEEPCDLCMPPIERHDDQAAIMQSVPFGVGARVEQELNRIQVSFPHGEMDCRGVPVLRAAESRVSFEQTSERLDVAAVGRGECIPDDIALLGAELGRFGHRARASVSE
jgi:hypothetical protein